MTIILVSYLKIERILLRTMFNPFIITQEHDYYHCFLTYSLAEKIFIDELEEDISRYKEFNNWSWKRRPSQYHWTSGGQWHFCENELFTDWLGASKSAVRVLQKRFSIHLKVPPVRYIVGTNKEALKICPFIVVLARTIPQKVHGQFDVSQRIK